jgi:hypothetical protein
MKPISAQVTLVKLSALWWIGPFLACRGREDGRVYWDEQQGAVGAVVGSRDTLCSDHRRRPPGSTIETSS